MSNFDFAGEKLKSYLEEWRSKRREARSGEISAAQARAEKRRGMREHVPETIPPTISVGEVEQMATAAAVGRATTLFDEEPSIPTIDVGGENPYETIKVSDDPPAIEEIAAKPKRKSRVTDEEPTIEDDNELAEEASLVSTQNYDSYTLPDPSMLTSPDAARKT